MSYYFVSAKNKLTPIFLWVLGCCLLGTTAAAQSGVSIVEDLTPRLLKYDAYLQSFVPCNPDEANQGLRTFSVDIEKYHSDALRICNTEGGALFHGKMLLRSLPDSGCISIPVSELPAGEGESKYWLTLAPTPQTANLWQVQIVGKSIPASSINPTTHASVTPRVRHDAFQDSQVIVWVLWLALLIGAYYQMPKTFIEVFAFGGIFALFQREENLLKASFTDRSNLVFMVLYGMSVAVLFQLLLYQESPNMDYCYFFGDSNTWYGHLGYWLFWSLCWVLIMSAKWVLTVIVSGIFSFGNIRKIQFYNHLRISLLLITAVALVVLNAWLGFPKWGFELKKVLFVLVPIFVALRVILLFLKLRRISSHRNVHLISYLCTTEIAPSAIFLKIFYSI